MDPFEQMEIVFRKGGRCGFPVRDGVSRRFQGLEGRDSRPFEGVQVADQATLRLEVRAFGHLSTPSASFFTQRFVCKWPGYPSWYTYVSPTAFEVDNGDD